MGILKNGSRLNRKSRTNPRIMFSKMVSATFPTLNRILMANMPIMIRIIAMSSVSRMPILEPVNIH
jgi:hypothetical protein